MSCSNVRSNADQGSTRQSFLQGSRSFVICAVVALIGFASTSAIAQERSRAVEVIETKGKKAQAVPDFSAELGLRFEFVEQLHNRIRVARKLRDPVSLACSAQELGVAEKVSGKQATLTSEALADEAAQLAKRRFKAKELKAVALLTGNDELVEVAKKAAESAAIKKAALESGEKTRGIQGTLTVVNEDNPYPIRIYIDDEYVGTVYPEDWERFYIGQGPYEETYLDGADGVDEWSRVVDRRVGNYTWTLTYSGR